jgi:hypothetical protein
MRSNRDFIAATIEHYQKSNEADNARLDRDRRKDVKPQFALSHYAGTYESRLFGQLVVKEVDGTLHIELGPNIRSELVHWEGERFRATFVVRSPKDWFLSFDFHDGHATKVTIVNVFPNAEIATFVRS